MKSFTTFLLTLCLGMALTTGGKAYTAGPNLNPTPFQYTINGDFIAGEPDANYLSHPANVQVGVSAVFTVYNTDTRIRHSAPTWSVSAWLRDAGNNTLFPVAPADTASTNFDSVDMNSHETKTYGGNFSATGSVVNAGSYSARGFCTIFDAKTPDSLDLGPFTKAVTVN